MHWLHRRPESFSQHTPRDTLENTETLWTIPEDSRPHQRPLQKLECSVLMDNTQTDYFPIKSGVRQGCILSPILFNITLDYIMRQTTQNARHDIQCSQN